jgi:iron complex outermembrane receptor protein
MSLKRKTSGSVLSFLLVASTASLAQESVFRVGVSGRDGRPLPYATVTAFRSARDSSVRVADSAGIVLLSRTPGAALLIRAEALNHLPRVVRVTPADTLRVLFMRLEPDGRALAGVVVTARKPLLRQEDDKTIVDPEPVAASSTNAYEILEKVPGVFTDPDGNVYLSSTSPARIYINGIEQKISNADVATLLRSLPPNAVEKIEILRTPSARFDAAGSGGILNIVLKKNVRLGITGSVTAGFNQGVYGNRYLGFNLSKSQDGKGAYVTVQGSTRNGFDDIASSRQVTADTILRQTSHAVQPGASLYLGFGMNRSRARWDYGFDTRLSLGGSENRSSNPTTITKLSDARLLSANANDVLNAGRSFSFSQDVNVKYRIDSLGSEWISTLSLGHNPGRSRQDIDTRYSLPAAFLLEAEGDIRNRPYSLVFESNLTRKLKGSLTVETGVKTSNVWFSNDTRFDRITGSIRLPDPQRSSAYDYTESIHAAYAQASRPFAGFLLKTGLRVENTNMTGFQRQPADTSFRIRRTDLFPYAYLSRKVMSIAGYELRSYLVYRRTIARPSYDLFNPSVRVVDQYLYETGNPRLRPQFTQNWEVNISAADRPIVALGRNITRDIFTQVLYTTDSNRNVAVRTQDNLGANREDYFRIIGAIPPGGKYFFVVGAQYNFNAYDGVYEKSPLTFRRGSWTLFTFHMLKLGKHTQATMNGFWRMRGQLQFYELGDFGQLNLNITQNLLKRKLSVTASVNDIFYTNRYAFRLQQGTVTAAGERRSDTRRFGLNLRYNFGIRKKEPDDMFRMDVPGMGG